MYGLREHGHTNMFLCYFNTYIKISVSLRFSAISMNSNLEVLNLANVVGLTATAVDAITRRCSKYVEMLEIVWRSLIQVSKKNCMEIIVYMTFGLKLREPKVIKVWQVKLTP